MEFHPRLDPSNLTLSQKKIILGSFPVWSLALSHDNKVNREKTLEREKNGDFEYFYGSSTNKFWSWYKSFIDQSISIKEPIKIKQSLERNRIGITDIILSCKRYKKSALDKHLTGRSYNYSFFNLPSSGDKLKILCTSKGLMNQMLLTSTFLDKHIININREASNEAQNCFLEQISGSPDLLKQPIYQLLDCSTGGQIECFALPSPGSPYRRLKDFGLVEKSDKMYLDRYLAVAFGWLNAV